jgi:hypothetical protein
MVSQWLSKLHSCNICARPVDDGWVLDAHAHNQLSIRRVHLTFIGHGHAQRSWSSSWCGSNITRFLHSFYFRGCKYIRGAVKYNTLYMCREDAKCVKSSACRAEVGAGVPRRYRLFPPNKSRVTCLNVGRGAHKLLNAMHGSREDAR